MTQLESYGPSTPTGRFVGEGVGLLVGICSVGSSEGGDELVGDNVGGIVVGDNDGATVVGLLEGGGVGACVRASPLKCDDRIMSQMRSMNQTTNSSNAFTYIEFQNSISVQ